MSTSNEIFFQILLESIKNWPKTMSNIEQLIIFVENLVSQVIVMY